MDVQIARRRLIGQREMDGEAHITVGECVRLIVMADFESHFRVVISCTRDISHDENRFETRHQPAARLGIFLMLTFLDQPIKAVGTDLNLFVVAELDRFSRFSTT